MGLPSFGSAVGDQGTGSLGSPGHMVSSGTEIHVWGGGAATCCKDQPSLSSTPVMIYNYYIILFQPSSPPLPTPNGLSAGSSVIHRFIIRPPSERRSRERRRRLGHCHITVTHYSGRHCSRKTIGIPSNFDSGTVYIIAPLPRSPISVLCVLDPRQRLRHRTC